MRNVSWEKIRTQTLLAHKRLTVVEDEVKLPTGLLTTYLRFENYAEYPTIIAEAADGRVLVIEEYSYPVDETLLQFPEGSMGPGESVVEAASRELAEEAGMAADNFEVIGFNYHSHRRTAAKNYIVLATGLSENLEHKPDIEEGDIRCRWLTAESIWRHINDHKIKQKNFLAAWAMYQSRKQVL